MIFFLFFITVLDYYDHSLGGLVIEAHVHGLPTPNVKFYKDNHLIHARKNKVVFFLENKEIFQCLMVRPDASASGTYTILADNIAGKRRFDHHVDFVTKYPHIHLPGMYHADKNLEDFVEVMLEKIPKQPEQVAVEQSLEPPKVAEVEKGANETTEKENVKEQEKPEVPQAPKVEEIVEALQAVATDEAKPKEKKSKSKHRKKTKPAVPKIDDGLVDDGEDEPASPETIDDENVISKRKFSTVIHEPYEEETFRIFNSKSNLWWSGSLRDQTAIEGQTIKLVCAVSGPLPIMKWFKNGKPVPWGATIRNMTGDGLGLVIIDKITRTDAGTYSCTAKNSSNEVTTEAVIKVIPKSVVPKNDTSKPTFTRVLGEFYRNVEDDLILEAHVRGVPEPKILWYKDGNEINAAMDSRYDFSTDHDGGYLLRIHKPNAEDSGLYACEAVNTVGKAKVMHKVNFTDLERHTHPQFVYHKESMWQPTLKMSIEPEPIPDISQYIYVPEVTKAAGQSETSQADIPASQNSGNSSAQESSGNAPSGGQMNGGGSGSGGDGNDDDDKPRDIPKTTEEVPEEEEEEVKKPEKREKRVRRRRYEDPVEPLLIRDSVSISLRKYFLCCIF